MDSLDIVFDYQRHNVDCDEKWVYPFVVMDFLGVSIVFKREHIPWELA